jgi:hypothetical protein
MGAMIAGRNQSVVWRGFLWFFIALLCNALPHHAAESRFLKIRLAHGISLELPRSWYVFDAQMKELLLTHVEALLDLSQKTASETGFLLLARSLPLETYATVNITVTKNSLIPSQVANWSSGQLSSYSSALRADIQQGFELQGNKIVEWLGTGTETINNQTVLITRYRRSLKGGPIVYVELYQFPTGRDLIGFTSSYRESEWALWKSVVLRIRSSFRIQGN